MELDPIVLQAAKFLGWFIEYIEDRNFGSKLGATNRNCQPQATSTAYVVSFRNRPPVTRQCCLPVTTTTFSFRVKSCVTGMVR